jgi:hypothetical protein
VRYIQPVINLRLFLTYLIIAPTTSTLPPSLEYHSHILQSLPQGPQSRQQFHHGLRLHAIRTPASAVFSSASSCAGVKAKTIILPSPASMTLFHSPAEILTLGRARPSPPWKRLHPAAYVPTVPSTYHHASFPTPQYRVTRLSPWSVSKSFVRQRVTRFTASSTPINLSVALLPQERSSAKLRLKVVWSVIQNAVSYLGANFFGFFLVCLKPSYTIPS